MGVEQQDDSLGESEIILQSLLVKPGAGCSKVPVLHVIARKNMWMQGMGKLAEISQDGPRCIMLCLKRVVGRGTNQNFHFSSSMGSVALILAPGIPLCS